MGIRFKWTAVAFEVKTGKGNKKMYGMHVLWPVATKLCKYAKNTNFQT